MRVLVTGGAEVSVLDDLTPVTPTRCAARAWYATTSPIFP
jgi:hypothetical protein